MITLLARQPFTSDVVNTFNIGPVDSYRDNQQVMTRSSKKRKLSETTLD